MIVWEAMSESGQNGWSPPRQPMLEPAPATDESDRNESNVSLTPFSMAASWTPFGSLGPKPAAR
jgi:hypothetical protein